VSTDRFARLTALFAEAMTREPGTRGEFLDGACGGDAALRAEISRLIAAADEADAVFERERAPLPADLLAPDEAPPAGGRIGAYQVTRLIGFGGMGAVYEAVRADDQYRKRVALKVIKRGMDTDQAIRRFKAERQILAGLDHRHIAGLLDGGVMDDGRPYFVLEYVDGLPITRYSAEHRLDLPARLALFRQVCGAVQYAHRNLVVHRDLKPGNILVTEDGTVKLLDFGIAKLLHADDASEAPPTRGGVGALTPEYASPEMVRGLPLTTSADVYSLGVVLFELVAGQRPFRFPDLAMGTIERIVCEEPAPRPSEVATEAVAQAAGERSVARYRRRLAGEVDTIVLKALRKEPERRYASAEALAQDLDRYGKGLPVSAQGDSAGYRLRKFVRRNTAVVGASFLVALSLVAGLIMSARQARRADRERAKAQEINRFVTDMLAAPDPAAAGKDVLVVDVLQRASARVDSQLRDQPEIELAVRSTLGNSYFGLGKYPEAKVEMGKALALAQRLHGVGSPEVATVLNALGNVAADGGEWAAADSIWRSARGMLLGVRAQDSLYASVLEDLGTAERRLNRLDSAETFLREALALKRRMFGERHPELINAMTNLGVALGSKRQFAEAESLHREALAISLAAYGRDHPITGGAWNALAGVLDFQDKFLAADSAYEETLAIRKKILGPGHPDYLFTLFNYATLLSLQNRCDEAVQATREILTHRGKELQDSHPAVATSLQTEGRCLDKAGQHEEAGRDLQESLEIRRKSLPAGHWLISVSESVYGEHLGKAGKNAEAEPLLVGSYQALAKSLGEKHPRTVDALKRVVTFYEESHQAGKAGSYRAKLPQ
jgi:serine/threonine-protein kinase